MYLLIWIDTPAFFWLVFTRYTFLHPLGSLTCLCLYSVFRAQYIVSPCFYSQSNNLWILIWLFIFNEVNMISRNPYLFPICPICFCSLYFLCFLLNCFQWFHLSLVKPPALCFHCGALELVVRLQLTTVSLQVLTQLYTSFLSSHLSGLRCLKPTMLSLLIYSISYL